MRYLAFSRRILEEEPAVRETITASFGNLSDVVFADMVDRAKVSGEFRSDLPTDTAVFVIQTLVNRMDSLIPLDWDDENVLQAIDKLLDVIRYGVGARL